MNNNQNGRNGIDIPNWLIVLALISAFPLGIILLIVKIFVLPFVTDIKKGISDAASDGRREIEKLRAQKKKRIRMSVGEVCLWIAAAFTLVLLLGAAQDITEGISGAASFVIVAAITSLLAGGALSMRSARERYSVYRSMIGDRTFMELSTLSSMSGIPKKKVIRDLVKMITKGYLGNEAAIDVANDVIFLTREAVDEFSRSHSDRDGERRTQVDDEAQFHDRVKPDEYRRVILEIRRLNDEIADIAVSERIYRIEEHTQHIFDYVKEHPEKKNSIRTFMNYYLPTTLKLLAAYAEIEKVGVAGDNMKKSKESIEKTLDLIDDGFKKQLDMLYEMKNIDISSDIEVLETMMKKDGMIDSFGGAAALEKDCPSEKKTESR